MNKKLPIFLILAIILFTGCNRDDIDALRAEQEKHAQRLTSLEEWQKTVNANITSLQSIVKALQDKDFVTGVTPLADGTGYTINFVKSGAITVKHGTEGATPQIGVKVHVDGFYYWTLNGKWLTDAHGNKIPATGDKGDKGDKGDNAVAPQLRINPETNEWEISADGRNSWISTGIKATGPKGDKGDKGEQGDAIFAKDGVDTTHADYIELTLADGTTRIQLPRYKAIKIGVDDGNGTLYLNKFYPSLPGEDNATVNTVALLRLPFDYKPDDYTAIAAEVVWKHGSTGNVLTRGTLPNPNYSPWSVTVFDLGGQPAVQVLYSVKHLHLFSPGESALLRVTMIGKDGAETTASRAISIGTFTDSYGKTIYIHTPGTLKDDDVREVLSLGGIEGMAIKGILSGNKNLGDWKTLKDGLNRYVKNTAGLLLEDVITVPDSAFADCDKLNAITLHKANNIGNSAFADCNNLEHATMYAVTDIGESAFKDCAKLRAANLSDVKNINFGAFAGCRELTYINLPKAVRLRGRAFDNCNKLSMVELTSPDAIEVESGVFGTFVGISKNITLRLHENHKPYVSGPNGSIWKNIEFGAIIF